MNPDDPLEQLKALKQQQGGSVVPGDDPLEQLKGMKRLSAGNIDLRGQAESTGVSPRTAPVSSAGAAEGVLDAGLNQLTFGLHQKGLGLTNALLDVIAHGTGAHPIDTYKQSTEGTQQRISAANTEHPLATKAAEATGFFAPLAAEAPLRALAGLPEAVAAARAPGFLNALKRVGQNTAIGGATGAALTGTSSDGPIEDRPGQMVTGGLLGALLGGGATAASEGATGAWAAGKKLFRSAETKGAEAARQQVLARLAAGELSPEDLATNAAKANAVGSPAVAAHLGGPALDDLTYLGASSMSPSGAALKTSLTNAQRGEHDLLHGGVTAMSGIARTPNNQADTFLQGLQDAREAAGQRDYPAAYAQPDITDPNILKAIRRDPDLRAALNQGVGVMRREAELERIQSGSAQPKVVNPLSIKPPQQGPVLNDIGEALVQAGVPEEKVIAQGYVREPEPADRPTLPIQMLDYMKQGVGPVIERGIKKGQLSAHDAGIINEKVQTLLGQIDNPVYETARRNQAALFGQIDAGQAGTKAFGQGPEAISARLADLSPTQQGAYRTTATSSLRDRIDAKRFGADVGRSLFDSPEAHGQLNALYGPDARESFDPYLEQSGILNRVLKAATGGSQTEPRQAVRAAVKDVAGTDLMATVASRKPLMAKVSHLITNGHSERVQRAVSETLAQELNIPADSPEIAQLVQRLYQSAPKGRRPPSMIGFPRVPILGKFPGVSDYSGVTLAARLGAVAGGGQ